MCASPWERVREMHFLASAGPAHGVCRGGAPCPYAASYPRGRGELKIAGGKTVRCRLRFGTTLLAEVRTVTNGFS